MRPIIFLFIVFLTLPSCDNYLPQDGEILSGQVDSPVPSLTAPVSVANAAAASGRQHLVMESLFDNKSSLGLWSEHSVMNHWNLTICDRIKEAGAASARFELRRNPNEFRTELGRNSDVSLWEGWYGLSYYIPGGVSIDPSYEIIGQWSARPDLIKGEKWRSPPLALCVRNGMFRLEWRTSAHVVNLQNDFTYHYEELGEATRNRWHDWVFHVKWGYNANGILEIWHNGVKVMQKFNVSIGYNDLTAPYFKCGIYKPDWRPGGKGSTSTLRVLFVDNVRIGNSLASYADVKP